MEPLYKRNPVLYAVAALDLDVVSHPIDTRIALIDPAMFQDASLKLLEERYEIVTIMKDEQVAPGINVFSLSPETVISDQHDVHISRLLVQTDLEAGARGQGEPG